MRKPISKYKSSCLGKHFFLKIIFSFEKRTKQCYYPNNEIYKECQKKIKSKNDKEFGTKLWKPKGKLFYFILAYPQKVVLVKSGEKMQKTFLDYEFSNRRGSIHEGIQSNKEAKTLKIAPNFLMLDILITQPKQVRIFIKHLEIMI